MPSSPTPAPAGGCAEIHITLQINDADRLTTEARHLISLIQAAAEPPTRPTEIPQPGTGDAVTIDAGSRAVRSPGGLIDLTRREFDLLLFLARNPRQAFSRAQLLEQIWDGTGPSARTVDVHVRRVRVKLDGYGPVITTVHRFGYRLDPAARIRVEN